MAYTVDISPAAARTLRKLDRTTARRIADAIDGLADDPRPNGVTKLEDRGDLWRIRVGEYRIIYEIHDKRLHVLVVHLGHRRDIYRRQ